MLEWLLVLVALFVGGVQTPEVTLSVHYQSGIAYQYQVVLEEGEMVEFNQSRDGTMLRVTAGTNFELRLSGEDEVCVPLNRVYYQLHAIAELDEENPENGCFRTGFFTP